MYNATVHYVLLYICETWSIRVEDAPLDPVFDHPYLRSIAHVSREHGVSNYDVRGWVLGVDSRPLIEAIALRRFRLLGQVLCMHAHCLTLRYLSAREIREKQHDSQAMMWRRVMKK